MTNYEYLSAIIGIGQVAATILLAIVVHRFSVRSWKSSFETTLRQSVQELNIRIMEGSSIKSYFEDFDTKRLGIKETDLGRLYYVYYELNNLISIFKASKNGLATKDFLNEAIRERASRLKPHSDILILLLGDDCPYPSELVTLLRKEIVVG